MTTKPELHQILYITPDGKPKSSGSYSSRATFKHCKRLFQLTRVLGWRHRREGVAMDFGKIVEDAVVYHYKNGGRGGVERFQKLWDDYRESKDFDRKEYTKVEVSWENMRRIGTEWLMIFAIRFKQYPFAGAVFQLPLTKKIFAQTSYDKITNTAYIDIYSEPDPNHPLLVRVPNYQGAKRALITDVKTASKELPERLISLDPQLIEYAWMYDVPDVAFLWFVKKSHGFKFGSHVTLLQDCPPWRAGDELTVLDKDGDGVWISTHQVAEAYDKACQGPDGRSLTGNKLKQAAAMYLEFSPALLVPSSAVSKQLVQFASARLTRQQMEDMGKVVGQTTVEMVVAHEQDFYPMEPGVRFPSEKCPTCDMRFICSGDTDGRDKFLSQAGFEWLDSTIEE